MNNVMEEIKKLTNERLLREEGDFNARESNLVELVRQNYDDWVRLFEVLKLKKIGCYDYLVELLASEKIGVSTSVGALRKAFSLVRIERGERVFKGTGKPYRNQDWDNTSRQAKSVTPSPQKIERARYSREELGTPAAGPVGTQTPRLERPVPAVGGPITWSIGSAEEKTPTTFAGVVLNGEVFLRDMGSVRPLLEEIAAQGNEEAVLACLAFLKAYCDKCGFRSSGEGAKLQPHNWLTFLPGLVKSLQNRLSTLEERKAL